MVVILGQPVARDLLAGAARGAVAPHVIGHIAVEPEDLLLLKRRVAGQKRRRATMSESPPAILQIDLPHIVLGLPVGQLVVRTLVLTEAVFPARPLQHDGLRVLDVVHATHGLAGLMDDLHLG